MLFSSFSINFAATTDTSNANATQFKDVTNHWGAKAINKWSGYGIINGNNGLFRPDDSITRGEIAVILDNMMGYQTVAKNTFTDLKPGKFYTTSILKAKAAGIISGGGNMIRPSDKLTREEAVVILAKAFAVNTNTNGTASFKDSAAIASWAKSYVKVMEAKGYVKGSNSNFSPKANITRAEIITMIDNIVKAYYTKAGTYTEDVKGTAVVKVSNVTLKGISISENLIVAEGVGQGDATLDSVRVNGNTIVRGGGENSVHIVGESSLTQIKIEKSEGKLRIVISDGNTVKNVDIADGEEIIVTGTVATLEVSASNAMVYATAANINEANVTGENSTVILDSKSKTNTFNVFETGKNASIQTQEGAQVGTIVANAGVNISGQGKVSSAVFKSGANGSSITTPDTQITVDKGVSGVTGGGGKSVLEGSTKTNNAVGNNLVEPLVSESTNGSTNSSTSGSTSGGKDNGGATVITPVITNVSSPVFTTTSANNTVTVTLSGGTFKTGAITASDFTFAGTNAGAFATGTFVRTSDTVVTISNLTLAAGVDNTILVKSAALATQASSVSVAASTALTNITSPAFTTTSANNTVTVTLSGGTFKTGAITASDFTFAGTNAGAFATGTFVRTSDTVVTISNLTLAAGVDNTILVKSAAQATQGSSVSGAASTVLTDVTSPAFTTTSANSIVTVTLAGGTFVNRPIVASDFTFAGTNAGAFATGTFVRTSNTIVTISNLTLADGVDNTVLVKAAAQATQASSVSVAASSVLTNVTSPMFTTTSANNTVTVTLSGGTFVNRPIVASDFTFTGTNAGALAMGTFVRTSDTVVTILDLTLADGADNTVLVKAETQETQGSSVSGAASTIYFTFHPSTQTITDYDTAGGLDVVIPSTIAGIAVENIRGYAFYNKGLNSVTIPYSVILIDDYAFSENNLTSVTIPNSVVTIGEGAFKDNFITSLTLEFGIVSIGAGAFQGSGVAGNQISNLIIPSSVTTIGAYSFQSNAITNLNIPNSVTFVGDRAFSLNALSTVTIQGSMDTIETCAFAGNSTLGAAYFAGNAPTHIGDDIFLDSFPGLIIYYHPWNNGFDNPALDDYTKSLY